MSNEIRAPNPPHALLCTRRRAILAGAGTASAASLIAAATRSASAAGTGPFPPHSQWRFVFINHVTENPFFVPTRYGIEDACALFGCTYQWAGSTNSDVAVMINAMDAAIAAKLDGIAIPIVDPTAFNASTARARRRHPRLQLQRRRPARPAEQTPRLYRPGPLPLRRDDGRAHRQAGRLRRTHRGGQHRNRPQIRGPAHRRALPHDEIALRGQRRASRNPAALGAGRRLTNRTAPGAPGHQGPRALLPRRRAQAPRSAKVCRAPPSRRTRSAEG